MLRLTQRLLKCKKGAALVEYSLLVAGVALIGAASVSIFGHKTNDMLAMVAAVLPGAHADDNGPIVSGKIIETGIGANNADGNAAAIGLNVNAITGANGTVRLGTNVGAVGTRSSLVLEAGTPPAP
jgi:pilus assembly protein Flp/PilA